MKKMIIPLILLILLQACQVFLPTKVESLKLVLSPSISEETFLSYKDSFSMALKSELLKNGYEVTDIAIDLASSNTQATELIITKLADIGFLTKLSYFENRASDLEVLLTQTQLAYNLPMDDLSAWNDPTQLVASKSLQDRHYAGIYLGASVKGLELYQKFSQNEPLTWIDLNSAKWCHVLVTSQEGYIYPSLWLINNYSRRIGELFDHELVVKGYPELMQRLANQECDIALGPENIREEYATQWQKTVEQDGFGQSTSIYIEVKLIGLSNPILHDPLVYSIVNEKMDESFVKAIKQSLMSISDAEIKNPLLEAMDVAGLAESSKEEYETFLPAYNYLESIFN